jgi:hypothetical protein
VTEFDERLRAQSTVADGRGIWENGSPVLTLIAGKSSKGQEVSFPAPSVSAMLLRTARKSSIAASDIQGRLEWEYVDYFGKSPRAIRMSSHSILLDFFEHALTAITSSFQAIEAFANLEIDYLVSESFDMSVKKKGTKGYVLESRSKDQLERFVSTDDKLSEVLPKLIKIDRLSNSNHKLWNRYKSLKKIRDDVIHCKSESQYPRRSNPLELLRVKSLFTGLVDTDITEFPKIAVETILYFDDRDRQWPWLDPELTVWGLDRMIQK